MKLLLIASDRREFSGLLAHAGAVRRAALAVDWARSARIAGHEMLLVANGVGPKRAALAVDAAGAAFDAVLSIGFCGALDEKLNIGDIVEADRVITAHAEYGRGAITLYSADHVVQTAREKRLLRVSGASAVEMEAAGVAARAAALNLPFHCVKSVTDLAGETMANDFNAALRPDGHFDTMLILSRVLRRPAERLPELLRFRNRCARAARALGEFFAECRF